jgi:hypothetical protein
MDKVSIDRLRLSDLAGKTVPLSGRFQDFALLIFLRHLA